MRGVTGHSLTLGVVVLSAIGLLCASGSASKAGVVSLVSQNRFVDVTAPGIDGGPTREQRQNGTSLGIFNGNVSLGDPQLGVIATATQTSNIDLVGGGAAFSATGMAVINNIAASARPESYFESVFDVTSLAHYTLTYDQSNSARFPSSTATFSGPSGLGILPPAVPGGFSGDLQPGRYTLIADTSSGSSFDLRLSVTPGAAAVPLPPAVWTGFVMLLVLVTCAAVMRIRGPRFA